MDTDTLGAAKAFTRKTVIGLGAIKGAPCTVQNVKTDASGNSVVTLQWTGTDGTKQTRDVTIQRGKDGKDGENGNDGISVKDAVIRDYHLIITLSDDTEIDAGEIGTSAELSEDLTATVAIGSVTVGKKYTKGTALEMLIRDILIKVEAPAVALSLVPNTSVYDIVNETLSNVTLKAVVTKKTYATKTVKFYAGDTLLDTQDISDGGTFTYNYTPATPIKATTIFKAVVEDVEGNSSESAVTVSFVGKSYYGVVEPTVGEPTEAMIKALGSTLKTYKGYVYKNITCDYNKVVYAFPASFGALASIKDVENNINYTNSFTRITVSVDGISYYVYTQTDPSGADGVNLTFA